MRTAPASRHLLSAVVALIGLVVGAIVLMRCATELPPALPTASGLPAVGAPTAEGSRGPAPGAAADAPARTAIVAADFVADEARPLDDLPPGLQYVRVVHAADGRPVAGATVWYLRPGVVPHEARGPREAANENHLEFHFLQARGTATTTDAMGRAIVRITRNRFAVAASAGDAAGTLIIEHPDSAPAGGWVLPIRPCARLRIEVVDHAGAPVPHAPLACDHRGRQRIGMTDDHGVRDLDFADEVLAAAREGRIWVLWPGGAAIPHQFEAAASRVRIVLPAGGQLEVHCVDHEDRPIPGYHAIEFEQVEFESSYWKTDGDGVLRLPWAPLGKTFALRCWQNTDAERFAGPVTAGQTTRCRLRLPADHVLCRGRLLGANGEPISLTPFLGKLEPTPSSAESGEDRAPRRLWPVAEVGAENPWTGPLPAPPVHGSHRVGGVTEADGRFAFVLEPPSIVNRCGVLWLAGSERNADCRHVEFDVTHPPGSRAIELGDLVVGDEGLVLTGRVVTTRGQPVPDPALHAPWVADLGRAVAIGGDHGEFRVYRSPVRPEEPVLLTASAFGAETTHQGRVGERDVQVVLQKRPSLRLEALVDAEVLPLAQQVSCGRVEDPGSAIATAVASGDRWVFSVEPAPEPQALVAYLELGQATVHTATLAARDDHEVVHRADLRGRFHVLRLDVRGADGEPLAAQIRAAARNEDGTTFLRTILHAEAGEVRLLSMSPTAVIEVGSHEHEAVTVTAATPPARVVLRRLPVFTPVLRGDRAGLQLRLQERLPDGTARDLGGSHLAASFAPIRIEVVLLDAEGQPMFTLPLQPVPLGPDPVQELAVELAPDQLRQLQAAWSSR